MKYIVPAHMSLHGYADDHAIKLTFSAYIISAEATALRSLLKQWMDSNRLKVNSSKTEFILFCHPKQLRKCSSNYLKVCGEDVSLSVDIRYLGVYLDSQLSFKQHITHKCKVAKHSQNQEHQIYSHNRSHSYSCFRFGYITFGFLQQCTVWPTKKFNQEITKSSKYSCQISPQQNKT